MAYKDLSTPTMVTLTGAWLDAEQLRPAVEALPQAGALLPSLERAHDGLLGTQRTGEKAVGALRILQEKEIALDDRHDRKAKGAFGVLGAFAELADDPADKAAYLALRGRLFPHGVKVIQWSYVDEAGEAELVEQRLTKEDRALLKALPVPGGTLLDEHRARVKAALELGALEKERAALTAEAAADPAVSSGDVVRARNAWIRAVRAFVAVLGLEEIDDAARERILLPLTKAEAKAARNGRGTGAVAPIATPEGRAAEPADPAGARGGRAPDPA
jgi:hypothetical protein